MPSDDLATREPSRARPHVVVVGGGVSGLAAAWRLCRERHDVDVTVLEMSSSFGGHLRTAELEGIAVDQGAELFSAHPSEATRLVREVGLGGDLVLASEEAPALLVSGDLLPLPAGLVGGVPTDLTTLARSGVLTPQALSRLPLDHVLPATSMGEDISIGEYVGRRLGAEVVDRLVSPLLLAEYADRAVNVSMRSAAPLLFEAARSERSLLAAARRLSGTPGGASVGHAGIRGGVGRLSVALVGALGSAGAELVADSTVRALHRMPRGWQLEVGPTRDSRLVTADAVVLAVPAPAASRLLAGHSLQAETELSEVESTSVAIVTLLYRRRDLPGGDLPDGTGYLVPPSENRSVTSATYASHRWEWLSEEAGARGFAVVRCSLGTADDVEVLQRDDADLVRLAADDVAFVARLGRARPVASLVARWGGGLTRYTVGHAARMTLVTDSVHALPAITICGATFAGPAISACIARAEESATLISRALSADGSWTPPSAL